MKKQTMGEIISTLRKEKGMTQKDLAEKMQVTDKAVSKWERNLSCPDINSIPLLAETLGISVEQLLDVSSPKDEGVDKRGEILNLILKAVPLAMGVAVAVLSILGRLETQAGFGMLGLGLAALALSKFRE